MKSIKKFFLGFTAALLFLTGTVFSGTYNVFEAEESEEAENTVEYTPINRPGTGYAKLGITSAEGQPGDTVRIYVSVSAEDNMESFDVIIGWENNGLVCTNIEGVDAFGSRVVSQIYDGCVSVCAYSTLAIGDGHVAAMDFTIPEDARPGTVYNIDYVRLDTVATVNDNITKTVGVSGGTITVPDIERLSATELNMNVGEMSALVVRGYEGEVSWISDNTGVVTVADGVVKAVGAGSAVVYAVIENRALACKVNVTGEAVTSTVTQTQIQTSTTTVSSVSATALSSTVSSSDVSSSTGSGTAVSPLTTETAGSLSTIVSTLSQEASSWGTETTVTTITEVSGSGQSDITETSETTGTEVSSGTDVYQTSSETTETNISTVSVSSSETTVSTTSQASIETSPKTKVTMYVGDKLLLRVKGYEGEVKWVSSDENVVVVDSKGNIEAVGEGNAAVLALYDNQYLICEVEVLEKKMFSSGVRGDADGNGKVNIRDSAVIAMKMSAGEGSQLPDCADYNQDGVVNIRDAAAIARAVSKKYNINIHIIIRT